MIEIIRCLEARGIHPFNPPLPLAPKQKNKVEYILKQVRLRRTKEKKYIS